MSTCKVSLQNINGCSDTLLLLSNFSLLMFVLLRVCFSLTENNLQMCIYFQADLIMRLDRGVSVKYLIVFEVCEVFDCAN